MSATNTTTYTYTETATYLAGLIMGAISDLLAALGIDRTRLYSDWEQDEAAFTAWIEEQSLDKIIVECVTPGGTVAPIFEFPVRYETGRGRFVERQAALARYQAKLKVVPRGTTFSLFVTFRKARTPQPGWSPGARSSTEGLRSRSLGTLGEAPHAAVDLTMYR